MDEIARICVNIIVSIGNMTGVGRLNGSLRYEYAAITVEHRVINAKNVYEILGREFVAELITDYSTGRIENFWYDGFSFEIYMTRCMLMG